MTAQGAQRRTRSAAAERYPRVLPALTSMRFFAAAWVVAMHYSWWLPMGVGDLPILSQGGMAVDFFFVLSGFVLAHAHFDAVVEHRLDVRDFLTRRLARIYPMHAVTLLFYAFVVVTASLVSVPLPNPDRYEAWQLLLNVTLLHALQTHDAGAWNYPSWSIGAEWVAYLAFPIAAIRILRRGRQRAGRKVAILVAALVLTWAGAPLFLGAPFFHLHTNFGWVRVLPEFALGIALYGWGKTTRLTALASPLALLILCTAILLLAWHDMTLGMLVPMSLLILAGAEMARSGHSGFLALPLFIYAGEISYALYMVHLPVATLVLRGTRGTDGVTPLWALPLAAIAALVIALASHRYIEATGSRWLMRLSPSRRILP